MLTAPRLHSPATSRYGGMYVMGMAYRGTANNGVVQRLLHFAVSDVSDDVRRAAVLNIGFLLGCLARAVPAHRGAAVRELQPARQIRCAASHVPVLPR